MGPEYKALGTHRISGRLSWKPIARRMRAGMTAPQTWPPLSRLDPWSDGQRREDFGTKVRRGSETCVCWMA